MKRFLRLTPSRPLMDGLQQEMGLGQSAGASVSLVLRILCPSLRTWRFSRTSWSACSSVWKTKSVVVWDR